MGQKSNNASNQEPNISELVTKHIHDLDDKGKLQLPEDMPDWQKHVIRSEKRQRDAQSELGKTLARLKEQEAVNGVLLETASTNEFFLLPSINSHFYPSISQRYYTNLIIHLLIPLPRPSHGFPS